MGNHGVSSQAKGKMGKIIRLIEAGKHYLVLKDVDYIKRKCEIVKELKLKYDMSDKEKFFQVTVNGEGVYIV